MIYLKDFYKSYKRLEDTTWLFKSEQASHTCWLCKCYRIKWASYNKWQTTNSCRDIMINEILFQNIKHVWHLQSERNQRLKLKNLSYTIKWNLSSLTAQNKQTGSSFQNLSKLRQKPVQMQLCGVPALSLLQQNYILRILFYWSTWKTCHNTSEECKHLLWHLFHIHIWQIINIMYNEHIQ